MNEQKQNVALIIFVRNPEYGKVKSRLAATMGKSKALQVYIELLRHTREVALEVETSRHLFYSESVNNADAWASADFIKHLQEEGDLGNKMQAAFKKVLESCEKAIIIGSDCPKISPQHIEDAIGHLDKNDVVLGPSLDGGYYLLGMKKLHTTLFENMTWSTDKVYEDTVEKIKYSNLSYATIDALSDVDHEEDWEMWGWKL